MLIIISFLGLREAFKSTQCSSKIGCDKIYIERYIFGKMEQYGSFPIVAERQNRKQVLVGKFSASSMGVHLVIHVEGFS